MATESKMTKLFLLILLVTYVISDVNTAPVHSRSRRSIKCYNMCDGEYLQCSYVIKSVFEHFICLKVRTGCKKKCKNPEISIEDDVIIAPLSFELDKIWNRKS